MNHQNTPKAVQDCHLLLEWLIPQLDKFPRQRCFALGERIETGLLEVLEGLIDAAYGHRKTEALQRANRRLDIVRHLWRLSYRLQASSGKAYAHGSHLLVELGKQIGGWHKAVRLKVAVIPARSRRESSGFDWLDGFRLKACRNDVLVVVLAVFREKR